MRLFSGPQRNGTVKDMMEISFDIVIVRETLSGRRQILSGCLVSCKLLQFRI